MTVAIYRARELYSVPATKGKRGKPGKPARRGLLGIGRSHFFDEIESKLQKVRLGERAVGYTSNSVEQLIKQGIADARD